MHSGRGSNDVRYVQCYQIYSIISNVKGTFIKQSIYLSTYKMSLYKNVTVNLNCRNTFNVASPHFLRIKQRCRYILYRCVYDSWNSRLCYDFEFGTYSWSLTFLLVSYILILIFISRLKKEDIIGVSRWVDRFTDHFPWSLYP